MAMRAVLQLLLLLAYRGGGTAQAPLAVRASGLGAPSPGSKQDIRLFPSTNCASRCGNLTIQFPFGIGPDCFRHPDFAVTCDNTTNPPKLLLMDGVMEVTDPGIRDSSGVLLINMSHALPASPSPGPYNSTWTWSAPASNFNYFRPYGLFVSSCDLSTYLAAKDVRLCTGCGEATPTPEKTMGGGCYDPVNLFLGGNSFQLKYVLPEVKKPQRQIIVGAWGLLFWSINDQPTCAAALAEDASFACISTHSSCTNVTRNGVTLPGYACTCDADYFGNPYMLNGCLPVTTIDDLGYNISAGRNAMCSRSCGNIKVPFPFGLEDGCFARTQFRLSCNDSSTSWLSGLGGQNISYININEGFLDTQDVTQGPMQPANYDSFYFRYSHSYSAQWVIANVTCQEASQNISQYACVSPNSKCLQVMNTTQGYVGYRCKCMDGYAGNSYVAGPDGCQDINECDAPGRCQGICHNTNGSYSCAKCAGKTEYDTIKMKCTTSRKQIVLLGVVVGLSVGFGLLLLGLTTMFLIRRWRRDIQKQMRRKYFTKNHGLLLEQLLSSNEDASERTKIFSLEELKQATNNFDHTRILGCGGHGMVYKGILSDQRVVAVKKSNVVKQGEIDQFINEVAILSQINHRNIVKLYGCCLETEVPLLVYDFVPNGSLFEVLHSGSSNNFSLSWDDCLRIASEAARALYYLHSAASISVFHRDVKSSNILLDGNYTAKVSDFGASRLMHIDQTHVTTHVQGTFGYLDPQYFRTGQLTEKSDVYSFGVVLLELLLRRKPVFTGEAGLAQSLSSYFLGEMQGRPIKEIVSAQVRDEATDEEIINVASLAETCLRLHSEERPTMKEVEMSLQLILRAKRGPENNRAEAGVQSHSSNGIGPTSANSQRCYSLEQEFMLSASLAR